MKTTTTTSIFNNEISLKEMIKMSKGQGNNSLSLVTGNMSCASLFTGNMSCASLFTGNMSCASLFNMPALNTAI